MNSYEYIIKAQDNLVEYWEEAGKTVIERCNCVNSFNDTFKSFLNHCTACGGNWGGMLLTGIHELWPDVYDAIPDDMGVFAWDCICSVLILCGVEVY